MSLDVKHSSATPAHHNASSSKQDQVSKIKKINIQLIKFIVIIIESFNHLIDSICSLFIIVL